MSHGPTREDGGFAAALQLLTALRVHDTLDFLWKFLVSFTLAAWLNRFIAKFLGNLLTLNR